MNHFKQLRKEKGLTQVELAKKIEVSASYYIKVEDNFVKPSYRVLAKLKDFYKEELDLNLIFSEKKHTPPRM